MTPCGGDHEPPLATAIAAWVDVTRARKNQSVSSWMAWPTFARVAFTGESRALFALAPASRRGRSRSAAIRQVLTVAARDPQAAGPPQDRRRLALVGEQFFDGDDHVWDLRVWTEVERRRTIVE